GKFSALELWILASSVPSSIWTRVHVNRAEVCGPVFFLSLRFFSWASFVLLVTNCSVAFLMVFEMTTPFQLTLKYNVKPTQTHIGDHKHTCLVRSISRTGFLCCLLFVLSQIILDLIKINLIAFSLLHVCCVEFFFVNAIVAYNNNNDRISLPIMLDFILLGSTSLGIIDAHYVKLLLLFLCISKLFLLNFLYFLNVIMFIFDMLVVYTFLIYLFYFINVHVGAMKYNYLKYFVVVVHDAFYLLIERLFTEPPLEIHIWGQTRHPNLSSGFKALYIDPIRHSLLFFILMQRKEMAISITNFLELELTTFNLAFTSYLYINLFLLSSIVLKYQKFDIQSCLKIQNLITSNKNLLTMKDYKILIYIISEYERIQFGKRGLK
ncbi:hypothetical protein ACJX0J_023755, partial [Zea mays]